MRPPNRGTAGRALAHPDQERQRLRAAATAPRTLACGCQLPQHRRHLLRPRRRPRRLPPLYRPLGNPREHGGIRRGNHQPARPRTIRRRPAADHQRQRPAVCRHGFKCGRSGNALDLWAHATQQSVDDAVLDLCQRLGIPQRNCAATAAEQGRGNRSLSIGYRYNHLSPAENVIPDPLTRTGRSSRLR